MIIYSANKDAFLRDVRESRIENIIQDEIRRKLSRNVAPGEIRSWQNSLLYMSAILSDKEIPGDAGIAIEYTIPLTNRRVDFILTGMDANQQDSAIIIELKQWQSVELTDKDAIVRTFINQAMRETNHPSYQAWSYAALIREYNETVRNERIGLKPCAYLHNMEDRRVIAHPNYQTHIDRAPLFTREDNRKLLDFIKRFIRHGDSGHILYRIEHGVIKPSKMLADSLASMLAGNQEFILLDEQKLVYETAIDLAHTARNGGGKQTLIVQGGPGTGKSVVAINLLVELTKREMLVQYVTKNAAPRAVFTSMLVGNGGRRKAEVDNLFKGSGCYIDCTDGYFDALVVDEAHRLNEKSGLYANMGENQIKELIHASKLSVFFIDEDQRVTFQDIGSTEFIRQLAREQGSAITELKLESQFRCNGSDGYMAWVDHALGIRETANTDLDGIDYDFKVFDDPKDLRDAIFEKNLRNNKARMVAGYCWPWRSKKNRTEQDIIIDDFEAQWNFSEDGSLWLISPRSVGQVGCIHTCQGLELDYIGVIIGEDFVVRDGKARTEASHRDRHDKSIRGYKSSLKQDPAKARALADQIIKNTYRTLMTRGMKGCYIYCVDKETNEYFKAMAIPAATIPAPALPTPYPGLQLEVVPATEAKPYDNCVPIFPLAAAAGAFLDQYHDATAGCDWVRLPDAFTPRKGMFVIQVSGESMNRRIPNGSWCLFKTAPEGTRQGKVLLVQHRSIDDPETGGSYTVKVYRSEKTPTDDGRLINSRVTLSPDTNNTGYEPIVFRADDLPDLKVIGEFVAAL